MVFSPLHTPTHHMGRRRRPGGTQSSEESEDSVGGL